MQSCYAKLCAVLKVEKKNCLCPNLRSPLCSFPFPLLCYRINTPQLEGDNSPLASAPLLSLFLLLPLSPLSYKWASKIQLMGLEERCKRPQWGLGRSRSANRISWDKFGAFYP